MSRHRDPLPYVLVFILILVGMATAVRTYHESFRELLNVVRETAQDR